MKPKDILKTLQDVGIRSVWDEQEEKWYFSAIDTVRALTSTTDASRYWRDLKKRLRRVNPEVFRDYKSQKLTGKDGRRRDTDMLDMRQWFRLLQELPAGKAESFRMWLAEAGQERVREIIDPERGIDRALESWRRMGRSEKWILQRMMSQETRQRLTEYWGGHGIRQSEEFRALTNLIHEAWTRLTVQEHKELKGLKSQNLRDHMSEAELIFTALAEMSVRQIAEGRNAIGFEENKSAAEKGGHVASHARKDLEEQTGKNVITGENFLPSSGKKTR